MIRWLALAALLALVACNSSHSSPAPDPSATPLAQAPARPVPAAIDAGIAPAKPISTKASGAVTVLAEIPAWDVAASSKRMVVVDTDFLSVSARDATTGTAAWRNPVQTVAHGRHTLHPTPGFVIAWAGSTQHILDAATGRVAATRKAAMNGVEWRDGGCGLDHEDGTCAERCDCSFQVFDCATGGNLGKRYDGQRITRRAIHSKTISSSCWGQRSALLGRAGNLAIASVVDHGGTGRPPPQTVAIDLARGTEVWRSPHDSSGLSTRSSMSPDRKTCWFTSRDSALRVVDCAKGTDLWRSDPPAGTTSTLYRIGFVAPGQLFELRDTQATLYDERTGQQRWRVTLAKGAVGWPKGLDRLYEWVSTEMNQVVILDPATGTPTRSVPVAKDTGLISDRRGGFYLLGDRLVHHDADGAEVGRAALARSGLVVGDDIVLAPLATEVVVLTKRDLRELGRVTGKYDRVLVEGELGARRAALFRYDGKTVGTAVLIRINP